jgi:hypothetical protein
LNSAPGFSHSASLPLPGSKWRQWALGTLQGVIPLHPDHYLTERSAADDVHFCLLALAEAGNSPSPIAARIQSRLHRLESLLDKDTVTSVQATGGSAYNFVTRPFQYGRPRTIQLDRAQQEAVSTEIARLQHDCHAVEDAPPHDGDKTLFSTRASGTTNPYFFYAGPSTTVR